MVSGHGQTGVSATFPAWQIEAKKGGICPLDVSYGARKWEEMLMRKWNSAAALLAGCLVSSTTSFALSLQDRLSAWAAAPEDERLVVARALTLVASQGLPDLNEEFFESCIEFASAQPELQSKKIGEIGSMCVAMHFRFSGRSK
jgi:hypothetical protein